MRSYLEILCLVALAACAGSGDDDDGDDDDTPMFDAALAIDGAPGIDAAVCQLDTAPVECTDDPTCTALCEAAFCRQFTQLGGSFCTHACSAAAPCPDGWSCNNMSICRPPG